MNTYLSRFILFSAFHLNYVCLYVVDDVFSEEMIEKYFKSIYYCLIFIVY